MKKQNLLLTIGIITVLLGLAACNTTPATPPVPTVAPTEAAAPTIEPTNVPVETPTVEPTAPPTEPLHEHTWVLTKTEPTCTADGHSIETCECGEQRNETIYLALGHYTNRIETKYPTYDEEGEWEDVCYICGEVVDRGVSDKLAPPVPPQEAEPEPTATVAPQETVTPAPTDGAHEHVWVEEIVKPDCINGGIHKEVCACGAVQNETTYPAIGHLLERVVTKEATVEEEGEWKEVCKVCGEVTDTGKSDKLMPLPTYVPTATPTPKATVTPTPSPKPTSTPKPTATSKPTATPTPTPRPDPFEEYTWWNVATQLIRYKDETCTDVVIIDHGYTEEEYVTLYNYSDLKDAPQEVNVYDYPSTDAKVVFKLVMEPVEYKDAYNGKGNYKRGQVQAFYRCLETGWYYCRYNDMKGQGWKYGYVDDEYIKCLADIVIGRNGESPSYPDYCQFELPPLGPYKLEEHENIICKLGYNSAEHKYSSINGSCNSGALFNSYYAPDLFRPSTIMVFTVENPEIVSLHKERTTPKGVERLQYKDGLGYYHVGMAYSTNFTATSVGTTKVTITQYLISDYNEDRINPVFTLGEAIASTSFTITVTE